MVVVEAMAAGIPYVASDIPPIREVTDGGVGGLLFNPMDYKNLAMMIKDVLTEDSLRKDLMKGVNRYIEDYDWMKISCNVESQYRGLIK